MAKQKLIQVTFLLLLAISVLLLVSCVGPEDDDGPEPPTNASSILMSSRG